MRKMSQRKKGSASRTKTENKTDIFSESESQAEPQFSLHVTSGNQLIGQRLPECFRKKGPVKPKSKPSSTEKQNSPYAMVIPTGLSEVSDFWEGNIFPKVSAYPEKSSTKEYPSTQIPPAPPSTAREIPLLKVILKGKPAPKMPGSALHSVEKASKMLPAFMMEESDLPSAPPVTRTGTEISEVINFTAPVPATLPLKPALLPCVGNVKSLSLNEKKKKMTKYKVTLKKPKTILEPIISERKTETMEMETANGEIVSEKMQEKRMQSSEMEEAQYAVRMLVQEAKVLSEEESRPSSVKTKTKKKESPIGSMEEMLTGSAPRCVDEIIDSLWEQVQSKTISDSDRRIQEIMTRVMSRGMVQKTEELQEKSGKKEPSDISDISTQKQDMAEETDDEKNEERKETFVPLEQDVEPEEVVVTETEPTISEEDDVCITDEAGPWDIGLFEEDENIISKLRAILDLPLHVSREDILSLRGQKIKRFSRISLSALSKSPKNSKTEMSFLSSWKDGEIITGGGKLTRQATPSNQMFKHHHFCMVSSEYEIQPPFTHAGLDYHTPNKLIKDFPIKECRQSIQNEKKCLREMEDPGKSNKTTQGYSEILDEWIEQAEEKFTDMELNVKGNPVPTILTDNVHFWTLSPPKLHILPGLITQLVCPKYHGSFQTKKFVSFDYKKNLQTRSAAQILADTSIEKTDKQIEELLRIRLLQQKSKSVTELTFVGEPTSPDLTGFKPAYEEETSPEMQEEISDEMPSKEFLESYSKENIYGQQLQASKSLPTLIQVERPHVVPGVKSKKDEPAFLALPSDFESLHTEMQEHKHLICKMEQRKKENPLEESPGSSNIYNEDVYSIMATVELEESKKLKKKSSHSEQVSGHKRHLKRSKTKLKRSQSGAVLQKNKIQKTSKVQRQKCIRSASIFTAAQRSGSGPSIFEYVVSKGFGGKTAAEKLSALPKACKDLVSEWKSGKTSTEELEDDLFNGKSETDNPSDHVSDILPYSESKIDICADDLEDPELNKKIWSEIDLLTNKLMNSPKDWIFMTCRRGILYRKVGEVNKSFEDLDNVIKAEPGYLDAYWHRHFLYLLRGDSLSALDDLRYVLKRKPSYKIYMALGLLYENLNDANSALTNYTLAIHFNSMNYMAYYHRAKLYESSRNTQSAIGDYINTSERNPKHAEALKKQAEYFLSVKNYNVAISKFGRLLQLEVDPEAYLYRAEAYISQKMWIHALSDLTAAIRLCPSSWKAYYLRGCLMKNDIKQMDKAIMDLSISLLLNDGIENKGSYNQRGLIYINKNLPKQAAADFSNILEFEPNDIDSLINLGLINLRYFQNFSIAIIFFSKVISLDALQIKAYQFRGEAYTKLYQYQFALQDYTRIIHMEPNNYMYYFFLGDIFMKMKNKNIASFFLELIAIVDSNVSFPISCELAAVHCFLTNYDRATFILQKALEKEPEDHQLMIQLGTTQLEAKKYRDALNTFNELRIMMSKTKTRKWPKLADDVFYNLGITYMALKQEKKALVAFNRAIEINPRHAPCLYNRGLAKVHLNLPNGIRDFNRALAINSTYYEVYLSRASYYAMKHNYPKAILNCNEALKIYPNSVRALLYRGSIKYFIGAYKLAVVDLTKAIELRGNFALAFFNRAICYEALENYEKALRDYSIVLVVSDDLNFSVFINRGRLYYQLEDFENAKEDFREAYTLKPRNHKIIHACGLCLHKLGNLDAAKETLTKCIRTDCQFVDAYISRGNVYMDYIQEKETRLASYDYERAIKINPENVLARICLGYSLQVLGKFQKAWQQFSEALVIDPANDAALEGRAAVSLQMGSVYAAFQDLNAAIRIHPTAEFYNNRGVVNQHMKCIRDAMTDYKLAIELDPEYALAYYNAANIYLNGRLFKQALKYFDEAINLDPTDECAFINRAVTKVMLKDFEGATSDFDQAHQMCPYYAHIYLNRGNLYASLQEYRLAEKDFTLALEILPDDPLTLVQRANVRGKMGQKDLAIKDYKRAMELKEM